LSAAEAAPKPTDKVIVGDIAIDPEARLVTLAGATVALTTIEFDLLLTLARAAGRVKSREQLLLEVAERNFDVFDRSIDVHISSIRKKMGDDPKVPRFIVTIRSAGYMLRRPATEPGA
jgi:DNA-binding response OmpR family regulator